MSTTLTRERVATRLTLVREHIRCENAHDLEGVLNTFGDRATYDDEPWSDHREGRDGVRGYYEQLLRSVPDLQIDVLREHIAEDTIVVEVVIRGTHVGTWRGLPGTGRRVAVPLCGTYTFDENDRLAGERIYYDRATVLRQLGVFHEPQSLIGKLTIALTHPATIALVLCVAAMKRFKR
jgi:steroid delta-isomerase-like uncharacterized protein